MFGLCTPYLQQQVFLRQAKRSHCFAHTLVSATCLSIDLTIIEMCFPILPGRAHMQAYSALELATICKHPPAPQEQSFALTRRRHSKQRSDHIYSSPLLGQILSESFRWFTKDSLVNPCFRLDLCGPPRREVRKRASRCTCLPPAYSKHPPRRRHSLSQPVKLSDILSESFRHKSALFTGKCTIWPRNPCAPLGLCEARESAKDPHMQAYMTCPKKQSFFFLSSPDLSGHLKKESLLSFLILPRWSKWPLCVIREVRAHISCITLFASPQLDISGYEYQKVNLLSKVGWPSRVLEWIYSRSWHSQMFWYVRVLPVISSFTIILCFLSVVKVGWPFRVLEFIFLESWHSQMLWYVRELSVVINSDTFMPLT